MTEPSCSLHEAIVALMQRSCIHAAVIKEFYLQLENDRKTVFCQLTSLA
jgi:hypothetical protein